MLVDPCIPKGYSYTGPWKSLPGPLHDRNRNISSVQSGGNFSECRSAALKLLQKGKGPKFITYSWPFFNENALLLCAWELPLLLKCRWLHLSAMLCRISFHTQASGEILGHWKLFLHIKGVAFVRFAISWVFNLLYILILAHQLCSFMSNSSSVWHKKLFFLTWCLLDNVFVEKIGLP